MTIKQPSNHRHFHEQSAPDRPQAPLSKRAGDIQSEETVEASEQGLVAIRNARFEPDPFGATRSTTCVLSSRHFVGPDPACARAYPFRRAIRDPQPKHRVAVWSGRALGRCTAFRSQVPIAATRA